MKKQPLALFDQLSQQLGCIGFKVWRIKVDCQILQLKTVRVFPTLRKRRQKFKKNSADGDTSLKKNMMELCCASASNGTFAEGKREHEH
jgi:hypothetical protein